MISDPPLCTKLKLGKFNEITDVVQSYSFLVVGRIGVWGTVSTMTPAVFWLLNSPHPSEFLAATLT